MTDLCDQLRADIDHWCSIDPNSPQCQAAIDACVKAGCSNCTSPAAPSGVIAELKDRIPADLSPEQQLEAFKSAIVQLMANDLGHIGAMPIRDDLSPSRALQQWRQEAATILSGLAALRAITADSEADVIANATYCEPTASD